jgi:hypothetical protein
MIIKWVKSKNDCASITAYGTRVDIGNWRGGCNLDGGEPVENARQTE